MSENENLKYEDFYSISLKNFYEIITEILRDFHYSVHRGVLEDQGHRRIEIWRSSKDENDNTLVWIEVIVEGNEVDPYISTDVLRTMNEENVSKLFFFTNGSLEQKEKEVLDGKDHYVFSPTDIIETINALEKKKKLKHQKKRRPKGVPSGYTLLKNFLKGKQIEKASISVPTSKITTIADKYIMLARNVLDEIDKLEDINNIVPEVREKFKKKQQELLPEIVKVSIFSFGDKFPEIKPRLFSLLQYLLVYIGAVIEYESEEEMQKSRAQVESDLAFLGSLEEEVSSFKEKMMTKAQKAAWHLLYISIGIIVFFSIFFIFMMLD